MYEDPALSSETPRIGTCDVCRREAFRKPSLTQEGLVILVICDRCGKYRFWEAVEDFFAAIHYNSGSPLHRLSFAMRTNAEKSKGKRNNDLFPILNNEDVDRMLDLLEPSVSEKSNMLLSWISTKSQYPGAEVRIDPSTDYPLICAKNEEEINFYLDSLVERGKIERYNGTAITILTKGWKELEQRRFDPNLTDAFIAMWFDPSRSEVYGAISNAVTSTGYTPIRIDRVEHVNRIDDEIIARIRASRFLIADFTGQRNGGYFEAGFMLGLGRPVIWACQEEELSQVHFDTRQYNTITYSEPAELQRRLQFRIEAVIGPAQKAK